MKIGFEMNLTKFSQDRLTTSAEDWAVDAEYIEPMYNYLVHGLQPGSFFTAVLANDWFGAMARSHPANTVPALKKLSAWITKRWPGVAFGSYSAVDAWLEMTADQRRSHLEDVELIYSERDEVVLNLKNV